MSEIYCASCDNIIEGEPIVICSENFCKDCVRRCSVCNALLPSDEFYVVEGNNYCDDCYHEYFRDCSCCGGIQYRDDLYYSDLADDYYCSTCYEENFITCSRCRNELYRDSDDYVCTDSGDILCNECYGFFCKEYSPFEIDLEKEDALGIEIECYPKEQALDLNCIDGSKYFRTTTDGSLSDGGIEFQSCPVPINKLETFFSEIGFIEQGFKVDSSCGFHIHLNALPYLKNKNLSTIGAFMKKMIVGFGNIQEFLFATQPNSRRQNSMCLSFQNLLSKNYEEIPLAPHKFIPALYYQRDIRRKEQLPKDKYDTHRYCWLNVHSLMIHGTIEIRLHSGTTSINKMKNWSSICYKIFKYLADHNFVDALAFNPKKAILLLNREEKDYLIERIEKFNSTTEQPIAEYLSILRS